MINWKVVRRFGFMAAWLASAAWQAEAEPIKVEIRGEPGNYQLYRGGKPYEVRGAGTQMPQDFASLQATGGNSIRSWDTGDGTLLDKAHAHGLTVALCLNVQRERHGFDYGNKRAVRAQFKAMRKKVRRYRNHPALLVWLIGNELNHDYKDPRVYDAVNDIAEMIHELDPNHPVSTTTAGFSVSLAKTMAERAPALDFISVQFYGGLESLPEVLEEAGVTKPVMVTEWGTIGHWEVDKTRWGAPIELNSQQKANQYQTSYRKVLAPMAGRLVGNYVFLWGHKQERTPTWYGVFTPDGEKTPAVDVMQKIWTGKAATDPAPRFLSLTLEGQDAHDNVLLRAGQTAQAVAMAEDLNQGKLRYRWRLLAESTATQSGGDAEEMPPDLSHLVRGASSSQLSFQLPKKPGAYRLFVYVSAKGGGTAHANLPFYVKK